MGTVEFEPVAEGYRYTLKLEPARFKDFFLSMREFKCVEAPAEIQCHAPYPYAHPRTVTPTDFAWLEHALLFFYKTPSEFGAKLWNGLYYRLEMTANGLVGTPQAIDLNQIAAPPTDLAVPPFDAASRTDIDPDARAFVRLVIE